MKIVRMDWKLVWKEALVLSVLCAIVVSAVVVFALTSIDDRRTQKLVGMGAFLFVMILASAFGTRWLRARAAIKQTLSAQKAARTLA